MIIKIIYFIVTTILITLLSLEFISNIVYFLLVALGSSFLLFRIFLKFKCNITYPSASKLVVLTLFSSYVLFASIAMMQRDIAFHKITTIPKETLLQFYNSQDINQIPKESRYTWMGCFYRKIAIIPENKFGNPNKKAIGWKHNVTAAYYDINKDKYSGSYH